MEIFIVHHNFQDGQIVFQTAADAHSKLHPIGAAEEEPQQDFQEPQQDFQEPQLNFDQEILVFLDQGEEAICQSVEEENPADLRTRIGNILKDFREHPEYYRDPNQVAGPAADIPPERPHDPLFPMVWQLSRLVDLMMGSEESQNDISDAIQQLNIFIDLIAKNCWIIEFDRMHMPVFMEKSRKILYKAGEILFDGLTRRLQNRVERSSQKYACVTKLVKGFKDCCYLELEVKVTDLEISLESNTNKVAVRILGSWEIQNPGREEVTLDELIPRLADQGRRFQPNLESVLRGLQGVELGEESDVESGVGSDVELGVGSDTEAVDAGRYEINQT